MEGLLSLYFQTRQHEAVMRPNHNDAGCQYVLTSSAGLDTDLSSLAELTLESAPQGHRRYQTPSAARESGGTIVARRAGCGDGGL